ncbi:MAG: hypothetical protein ABSF82_13790 [Candidatus Bathyarchaeia archaeon]
MHIVTLGRNSRQFGIDLGMLEVQNITPDQVIQYATGVSDNGDTEFASVST